MANAMHRGKFNTYDIIYIALLAMCFVTKYSNLIIDILMHKSKNQQEKAPWMISGKNFSQMG